MRVAASLLAMVAYLFVSITALTAETKSYIGSQACGQCHEKELASFTRFAKKAHSFKSIQIMASKLEPAELKECYSCHTTGYGQPGGFISIEKTPALANAGCEVCHGPGSAHAESGDPALIKAHPKVEECQGCHNEQRVKSFGFKPMLFGGAH